MTWLIALSWFEAGSFVATATIPLSAVSPSTLKHARLTRTCTLSVVQMVNFSLLITELKLAETKLLTKMKLKNVRESITRFD